MGSCNICDNLVLTNDCNFILFLDNVKAHHLESKNRIEKQSQEIKTLNKLNKELNKRIIDVENKLKLCNETKRRRTDLSDLDATNIFRQVDLLGNLNNNSSLGLTLSENSVKNDQSPRLVNDDQLLNSVQNQNLKTPVKKEVNLKNILSPIENKAARTQKTPSNSSLLPKMLRSSNSTISPKTEWISTDKLKNTSEKCKTKINWEMSFIQPVKMNSSLTENIPKQLDSSSDIIGCSQNPEKENKRKDRNLNKLKSKKRLKQSKLEFDKKVEGVTSKRKNNQIDETLCEDFIDASPGLKEVKQVRTLRKLTRNNSDDELFDFKNVKKSKSSSLPTLTQDEFDGMISVQKSSSFPYTQGRSIKTEPITTRKKIDELDKNEEDINKKDNQLLKEKNNDDTHSYEENVSSEPSSCVILPSHHDVVCIDDTEDLNLDFNTADLFMEMLHQDNKTQPILKQIEMKQMKNLNEKKSPPLSKISAPAKKKTISYIDSDEGSDADLTHCDTLAQKKIINNPPNEIQLKTSDNHAKADINRMAVPHNCSECAAYKKHLIASGYSDAEIAERLKNCKQHKPLKLHLTPENFWEPRLLSFPENDPRNEVLVDYRFAKKIPNEEDEK